VDGDGDGWSNEYERMVGRDPLNPDQDRDGLPDGVDQDGDGMSNWFERNMATSLDPAIYNGRYYVQLMSIPVSNVNETENRRFWIEQEGLEPDHYIVEYSVTFTRFQEILTGLSQKVTEEDRVFLYLKTHGTTAATAGGEPTLCFADEEHPYEADRCGEVITYRQLNTYLEMLHPRILAIVYSSCAGTDAVPVLSQGDTHRIVIGVMGLTVGVPSVDLPILARLSGDPYFSVMDLVLAVQESTHNMTPQQQWIADPGDIAGEFYLGEHTIEEYRKSRAQTHLEEGVA
jgi:hypothetical protein